MPDARRLMQQTGRSWALALLLLPACSFPAFRSGPDLPAHGPFAPAYSLPQGVAAGDVTHESALIWTRTAGPSRVQIEWGPGAGLGTARVFRSPVVTASAQRDFTILTRLTGLEGGTLYSYRVLTGPADGREPLEERAVGQFRTATAPDMKEPVRFVWSADLGGQQHCRTSQMGYVIFDQLRRVAPAFALLLGDLIYGDERCSSPPHLPGSDFEAESLDEFRRKHRYQHDDPALQRFLSEIPVYIIWDDHEVRNNFSGPGEPLMPAGRQALLEYWPVGTSADHPHRLYRRIRRGGDLEIFILDTRQYRSQNATPDGKDKTMLGPQQRAWLLDGLQSTTATWKIVASSVPLSIPKRGVTARLGNDSWARAQDGTGFFTELLGIVQALKSHGVRNVVWLAADVHFAQINEYDPDGDGEVDFYEFVAGPLSARPGTPVLPEASLHPNTVYSAGDSMNFGVIDVNGTKMRVRIMDDLGKERFVKTYTAR
jgi:alkaline phosphatase D